MVIADSLCLGAAFFAGAFLAAVFLLVFLAAFFGISRLFLLGVYYYLSSIAKNGHQMQVLVVFGTTSCGGYTTGLAVMKTLIISDLHLSNRFDAVRAEYLIELLSEADRVILNGDFWDNHATTFDGFVRSPWKMLFPLLKARKTVYIFGNHDREQDSDERVSLFSTAQANHWQLRDGKLRLHIEHGHHILAKHHDSPNWVVTLFRVSLYDVWFRQPLEHFLVSRGNEVLHRWHMGNNQQELIEKARTSSADLLVTGHTHLPTLQPDKKFVNLGYVNHGVSYYVLVENEQAYFIKESYIPTRTVLLKESIFRSKKLIA